MDREALSSRYLFADNPAVMDKGLGNVYSTIDDLKI